MPVRRAVQLAALACFALPLPWGIAVAAGLAAVLTLRPAEHLPLPLLVLAGLGVVELLQPDGGALRPLFQLWPWTVSWDLVWSAATVALALAWVLLQARKAAAALGLQLVIGCVAVVGFERLAVPAHITEPAALGWLTGIQTLQWGIACAGLLLADGSWERPLGWRGPALAATGILLGGVALSRDAGSTAAFSPLSVAFLWPSDDSSAAPDYKAASSGYGFHRIGLYGEWPRVLERAGHRVRRVPEFDHTALEGTQVAILASAFRPWRRGESERLTQWVAAGGRLLVVGEHSDLDECLGRLNPLLSRFDLELNFDTTNGLLGDGLRGVSLAPGAFRRVLERSPLLPYNRGGSLSLGPRATALVVGRYWHADAGDTLAPERAFLSDYRLSPGDRVGGIPLMAESAHGRGWVLLVGDSTPFLNQNTLYSSRFLLGLVQYLGHGQHASRAALLSLLTLVVLTVAAAFVRLLRPGPVLALACWALLAGQRGPDTPSTSPARQAVVSVRENNVFDLDPFSGRSPTALGLAFARQDLTPVLASWDARGERPEVVAVLNPARPVDTAGLLSWAHAGSTIILAGAGDNPNFRAAASAVGVTVLAQPLGSLKGDDFTTHSAWRATQLPATAKPLSAAGYQLGAEMSVGQGRVVVVADSDFFLSRNLETESGADERNVAFLERLLRGAHP